MTQGQETIDAERQRRAERAQNADIMLQLAASATGLKESVDLLRRDISGSPNLVERISWGNWRVAAAALAVIVSISALVGSVSGTVAFFAWRQSWQSYPPSYSASAR